MGCGLDDIVGLPGRGLKTSLNCFGVSSSSPLPTLHRDRVETMYKGDGREVTCVSPMCQALANILEKFSAKKGNVISIIGTPSQPSLHILKLQLFCWLRASLPPPVAMPSRSVQATRRDRSERWSPTRRFLTPLLTITNALLSNICSSANIKRSLRRRGEISGGSGVHSSFHSLCDFYSFTDPKLIRCADPWLHEQTQWKLRHACAWTQNGQLVAEHSG